MFSIKKLLVISIVLILLSLSAVAASDDSQSIAIDENSDIQVPDTLLSSASDDLISADAGENSAGIYGASENSANDISSDEKQNATMYISIKSPWDIALMPKSPSCP